MSGMLFDGLHHVTCITADAAGNVDFYCRVLGLRMVKRSVNQDDPTVWHLFYGDEHARPGADLTFFEYRDVPRGRAADGMVHTVVWRVGSAASIDFWVQRLTDNGIPTVRSEDSASLSFQDPEGLGHALRISDTGDEPLSAAAQGIPPEHALQGFLGVRIFASPHRRMATSALFADHLGWQADTEPPSDPERDPREVLARLRGRGASREAFLQFDEPPPVSALRGAGTVHHIAFTAADHEHPGWTARLRAIGIDATPVIDRHYFRSIYFHEPGGVLCEIATPSPGFDVDEPMETLGEQLSLPPRFEPLREHLAEALTPLPDARQWR